MLLASFFFESMAIIYADMVAAVFTNNDFNVIPSVPFPACYDVVLLYDSTLKPQSLTQIDSFARALLLTSYSNHYLPR